MWMVMRRILNDIPRYGRAGSATEELLEQYSMIICKYKQGIGGGRLPIGSGHAYCPRFSNTGGYEYMEGGPSKDLFHLIYMMVEVARENVKEE